MSSRWFRHYVGLATDTKLIEAAHDAKTTTDRTVFVFVSILESAAERNDGGAYEWAPKAIAMHCGCDVASINRIQRALIASKRITKTHVENWSRRQFESDSSSDRVKRWRDKRRENMTVSETECNGDETLQDVSETAPEAEPDTDTDYSAALRGGARTKPVLDFLERKLIEAAGDRLDRPNAPGLFELGPMLGLIKAGFDLESEILPVLRSRAASPGRKVRYWGFYVDAIHDARAAREAAAAPRTVIPIGEARLPRGPRALPRNPVMQAMEEILAERQ